MITDGVPEAYPAVIPVIRLESVAPVIAFMERVLNATVSERYDAPDGGTMHAEVRIGASVVMLGDAPSAEAMPTSLMVWIPDVDDAYARAVEAGATSVEEPTDQFYGARVARLTDPWGNAWTFGTQTEEVSPEELQRRMQERPSDG